MINLTPASQFCLYTVVSVLLLPEVMGGAVRPQHTGGRDALPN